MCASKEPFVFWLELVEAMKCLKACKPQRITLEKAPCFSYLEASILFESGLSKKTKLNFDANPPHTHKTSKILDQMMLNWKPPLKKSPTAYLEILALLAYFESCPCIDMYYIHCCFKPNYSGTKQKCLELVIFFKKRGLWHLPGLLMFWPFILSFILNF